jgi:hypothetical protein
MEDLDTAITFSLPRVRMVTSIIPVKLTPQILLALIVLIFGVGFGLGKYVGGSSLEGFTSGIAGIPLCADCKKDAPKCECPASSITRLICPPCREPDLSKYVLKSSVPPCPTCPDLSRYMLKTECPPTPDLSKYVLKSSIPKQQPVIIDNSACKKDAGECPPCPRPRCPEVKCPAPTVCPTPAPCPRPVCPQQTVKCKSELAPSDSTVRPFMAPLSFDTFGSA